jgi:hypothetical protein
MRLLVMYRVPYFWATAVFHVVGIHLGVDLPDATAASPSPSSGVSGLSHLRIESRECSQKLEPRRNPPARLSCGAHIGS